MCFQFEGTSFISVTSNPQTGTVYLATADAIYKYNEYDGKSKLYFFVFNLIMLPMKSYKHCITTPILYFNILYINKESAQTLITIIDLLHFLRYYQYYLKVTFLVF